MQTPRCHARISELGTRVSTVAVPRGSWFRAELWGRHRYGVTPLSPIGDGTWAGLRAGPTLGRTTHPVSHSCEEPGRAPKCYYPMSPLRSFGQPAGACTCPASSAVLSCGLLGQSLGLLQPNWRLAFQKRRSYHLSPETQAEGLSFTDFIFHF